MRKKILIWGITVLFATALFCSCSNEPHVVNSIELVFDLLVDSTDLVPAEPVRQVDEQCGLRFNVALNDVKTDDRYGHVDPIDPDHFPYYVCPAGVCPCEEDEAAAGVAGSRINTFSMLTTPETKNYLFITPTPPNQLFTGLSIIKEDGTEDALNPRAIEINGTAYNCYKFKFKKYRPDTNNLHLRVSFIFDGTIDHLDFPIRYIPENPLFHTGLLFESIDLESS